MVDRRTDPADVDLGALFAAHQRHVLAYAARRTTHLSDAEDAAAETWVIAWRKRDVIPTDPLPWLYGVARRVLANQRRGTLRRFRLALRLAQPEPQVERFGDAEGPAMQALARLRPADQELLRLVAWEGLSQADIAAVLGISINAVAIRLHRARLRFEAEFVAAAGHGVKGPAAWRTSGSVKGDFTENVQEEPR